MKKQKDMNANNKNKSSNIPSSSSILGSSSSSSPGGSKSNPNKKFISDNNFISDEYEEEIVSDEESHIREVGWEYVYKEIEVDEEDRNMAGLLFENFREKAFDSSLNIGSGIEDPLKDLVYRVHPLPEATVDHVFDFGSLSATTEALYIRGMLRRMLGIYVSEEEQEADRMSSLNEQKKQREEQNKGIGMTPLPQEGVQLPNGTRLVFHPTTDYEYDSKCVAGQMVEVF